MGKRKLERFEENKKFENVLQPLFKEVYKKEFYLKGNWNRKFFINTNPIVLELGCGKGEYTVGLAQKYPDKNFIGIDIKGARMWKGACEALDRNLKNVAFLRTRIELINFFFSDSEVSEIWLTFPDPQLKKPKKRLCSPRFLNSYKQFLGKSGIVHLKTDNIELYNYTYELIEQNKLNLLFATNDLYKSNQADEILSIKTFYERQFLEQELSIKYIRFQLTNTKSIEKPEVS